LILFSISEAWGFCTPAISPGCYLHIVLKPRNLHCYIHIQNTVEIVHLQDVIQFGPLVKTLGLVMLNRPQILPSIFKQVGLGVILEWSGHFLMLGYYTFLSTFIDPVTRTWVESLPPRDKYQWKRYLEAWRYGAGLDYRQGE